MNYVEYNIQVPGAAEAEIVVAELAELGFESFSDYLPDGFMEGAGSVKGYIAAGSEADAAPRIRAFLDTEGYPYERAEIEQQNWNAAWEAQFEPIEIAGGMCRIRAPFHTPSPEGTKHEIVIMPKMSFGTGHHATTCLMAEQMLAMDFGGASVLDLGSGTGILAILAAQRGAVVVDAVDIDTWAYENCLENIRANGVETAVCPILGDISAVAGRVYDYILANINRNILLDGMERYAAGLRPRGLLLVSGILDLDVDTLVGAASRHGLTPTATNTRGGWAQITFQKS